MACKHRAFKIWNYCVFVTPDSFKHRFFLSEFLNQIFPQLCFNGTGYVSGLLEFTQGFDFCEGHDGFKLKVLGSVSAKVFEDKVTETLKTAVVSIPVVGFRKIPHE